MTRTLIQVSLIILILFLGSNVFIFFFFNQPPSRALFIEPVYEFETAEKIIALTFDDGPSPTTSPLLDLLKKHGVQATFFMIGQNIEAHRDIARRVVAEGHEVGSHTYRHERMIYRSFAYVENDVRTMDALLQSIGVTSPVFFRPPYGDKMVVLPLVLKQMHKTLVTWDVNPPGQYDQQQRNCQDIAHYAVEQAQPGSIIILHDGVTGDSAGLLCAVDKIITDLTARGFRFVTIETGLNITRSNKRESFSGSW